MFIGIPFQHQHTWHTTGYENCRLLKAQGLLAHAFEVCQAVEDKLFQEWAGDPFVYDIRKPNGMFDDLTRTLTKYFNEPATKVHEKKSNM